MFDCYEELSNEQENRIKKLIQTGDFRIINNIINACDLNQDEDRVIKNIKDYIWRFLSNYSRKDFSKKVDNFIFFIENYHNINKPVFKVCIKLDLNTPS
jgi:hypothetical protein